MAKDLNKLRIASEKAQARADKVTQRYRVEEAAQFEQARKQIGETTLSAFKTMPASLRDQLIAALVPTLSSVAVDMLVHEDLLSVKDAEAAKAVKAEAKSTKKTSTGGNDAARKTQNTGA